MTNEQVGKTPMNSGAGLELGVQLEHAHIYMSRHSNKYRYRLVFIHFLALSTKGPKAMSPQ